MNQMEEELHFEYSVLKLHREQYDLEQRKTDSVSLAFRPVDIEKYYQNRVKNPEGLNKILAFAVKNVQIHKQQYQKKVPVDEKLSLMNTYIRMQKELFLTPEIESFTEESREKAYIDMRKAGAYKVSKQLKDIKELKDSVRLGVRHELNTILEGLHKRQVVQKDETLKDDIKEFLEKYQDIKNS